MNRISIKEKKLLLRWLKEKDYFKEYNRCTYIQLTENPFKREFGFNAFEYLNNINAEKYNNRFLIEDAINYSFDWNISEELTFCWIHDEFQKFIYKFKQQIFDCKYFNEII